MKNKKNHQNLKTSKTKRTIQIKNLKVKISQSYEKELKYREIKKNWERFWQFFLCYNKMGTFAS